MLKKQEYIQEWQHGVSYDSGLVPHSIKSWVTSAYWSLIHFFLTLNNFYLFSHGVENAYDMHLNLKYMFSRENRKHWNKSFVQTQDNVNIGTPRRCSF